ncbi:MAG TPA: response regulator [Anaerolineales bacterium]|nr:response regulator [Anaerolineales bacterium]
MARILFVDDDPLSLMMFSKIIELSGHQAVTTADAEEALSLAVSQKPDIFFTDFQMPQKDGLEVIKALRTQEDTASIPAFLLSANADPDLIERVLEAGGQGFLRKPLRLDALLTTIEKCILGDYD